ncbi:guanylate kinase [Paenibacillus polymyxa]|uniref:guanylate kinase n=1 Tax=Paenibacillus polymyxa TaxID=1406 RepID=UPI0019E66B9E|nr:hypothetical protein H6F38_20460 [Paenibacillus sp. EKM208P]
MQSNRKSIVVISGPSTAGKSRVIRELLAQFNLYKFIISHTTRSPRKDEVQERDYHFIDRPEFMEMIHTGQFLQWKQSEFGLYGTSLGSIAATLEEGFVPLLDLDPDSYTYLKSLEQYDVLGIYIVPDSVDTLKKRIYSRGERRGIHNRSDADTRIRMSLESVKQSLWYEYLLENNLDSTTAQTIHQIIETEKYKRLKTTLYLKWMIESQAELKISED